MAYDEMIEARDPTASSRSPDDYLLDTMSIESSVTQYRIENGRRYHAYKDGLYWAPNDDKQNENLDIAHHKFLLLLGGKLLLAPISKSIERALDIGTGTGIWAIDFADEYPNTIVTGTDLSPIQPDLIPPNCRFEVDDVQDEWIYPPGYFDFIHIRSLFGSIENWPALYAQAFKTSRDLDKRLGKWITDTNGHKMKCDDGTLAADSAVNAFTSYFIEAERITGQNFTVFDSMTKDIKDGGFVSVTEKVYKVAMGSWPAHPKAREIGSWALLAFDVGLEGFALAIMTRVLGWSCNEIIVFLAKLRAEVRNRDVHCYHEIKVVYAQKPA